MAKDSAELKIVIIERKIETKLDAFVFGASDICGKMIGLAIAGAIIWGVLHLIGLPPIYPK